MDNNKQRRKILLGLAGAAGAGQLGQWSKPVIDTVILPAHATTTDTIASSSFNANLPRHFYDQIQMRREIREIDPNPNGLGFPSAAQESLIERGLSLFINEAHAGISENPAEICIDTPNGQNFTAKLRWESPLPYFWEATGIVGGGPANLILTGGCPAPNGTLEVTGISALGAQVDIFISGVSANGTIPENPGCPEKPSGLECPKEIEVIVPVDGM